MKLMHNMLKLTNDSIHIRLDARLSLSLSRHTCRLVCRQLLFSAANGSVHGGCSDLKAQKLIKMGEESLKEKQGFVSNEFGNAVLKALFVFMDSR